MMMSSSLMRKLEQVLSERVRRLLLTRFLAPDTNFRKSFCTGKQLVQIGTMPPLKLGDQGRDSEIFHRTGKGLFVESI